MTPSDASLIDKALKGDINAFQALFSEFQASLKSYLYRLTASRNDAEDLLHDSFIKAFDKIAGFRGEASLKTWVFRIATNLAYTQLKQHQRWTTDVKTRAKQLVTQKPQLAQHLVQVAGNDVAAQFDLKEHIDTCFTCMSKTLPVENQVTLMLKDVYDFSVAEIVIILDKTEGVVKYLLQDARKTMMDIFEHRCALINKAGVCNQCSELNGWFNPKQNQQEALMKLDLVKGSQKYNRVALYELRTKLSQAIDPLHSAGSNLQDVLLQCNRLAMGEISTLSS